MCSDIANDYLMQYGLDLNYLKIVFNPRDFY